MQESKWLSLMKHTRFWKNSDVITLLLTFLAYIHLSIPLTADDAFSNEVIRQSTVAMSAPIRFKVTSFLHKFNKDNKFITKEMMAKGFPKDIEKKSNEISGQGKEYVVCLADQSMGRVTRIESRRDSTMPGVGVFGDSRCFEFYPKQNTVIDTTFKLRNVQDDWGDMTEICRVQGDVVCTEDSSDKWLCRVTDEKLVVELRIVKSTKFVESKRTFDRNSNELLTEYRYSDFELNADFSADFFALPSAAKLLVAENTKDYSAKIMDVFKEVRRVAMLPFEERLKEDVPYKRDPKTGRLILHPPPGMSNEEFARKIGEGIENLPTPKGFSNERKKELAEKWKANTELKEVKLEPPRKADRGYGSVWLYLGVFLAIGTAVVVGIRFWMAN